MGLNTDQAANYVYQNAIERQYMHRFEETNRACHKCGNKLGIYYCEDKLYAVRCMHCEMLTLVKAQNPILAVKKVGTRKTDLEV